MNKPLPIAFLIFILGIIAAHYIPIPTALIVSLLALSLVLFAVIRKRKTTPFYVISAVLIFILGYSAYLNFNYLPRNHIAHLLEKKPKGCTIEAVIVSSPESYFRWGKRSASFIIKALRYKTQDSWIKSVGLCKAYIKDLVQDYSYGDTVVIAGRLENTPQAKNPGEFDYAAYLRKTGVYCAINADSDDDIVITQKHKPFFIKSLIFDARKNIELFIKRYIPGQQGAVLNAILIGRQSGISGHTREIFVKTGTAHILAVSGLNVVLISTIIFFILKLVRIPYKVSSIIVIGFLVLYSILAGAAPPILRATIMIVVYLLGHILERDFDIYSALSLAGILILIINPMQLFMAGFVLSFACVYFICYITPLIESQYIKLKPKNEFLRYLLQLAIVSTAVYIGILPLTAYYFNIISPITILANIFVVPLLSLISFLGIFFLIFGWFFIPLAVFLGWCLYISLSAYLKIIEIFSRIPFGYFYVPDTPLYILVVYYIIVFSLLNRQHLRLNWPKVSIILLLSANILLWQPLFFKSGLLRVTFLDTRSNAVFIEFPDGKTALILNKEGKGRYRSEFDNIITPFVWSRGIKTIDTFICGSLENPPVSKKLRIKHFKNRRTLNGNSPIRLNYKDAVFLFSPDGNSFYMEGKIPESRICVTEDSGAITVATDGREYSINEFLCKRRI